MSEEGAFPEFWEWDKDGAEVDGAYGSFTEIPTKMYGNKPAVILHVGKADRTIPLWDTALGNRFRDEIERRADGELVAGERVLIQRGDVVEGANGYKYRAYKVRFPDAPSRSAREILGAKEAGEPDTPEPKGDSDDLPF